MGTWGVKGFFQTASTWVSNIRESKKTKNVMYFIEQWLGDVEVRQNDEEFRKKCREEFLGLENNLLFPARSSYRVLILGLTMICDELSAPSRLLERQILQPLLVFEVLLLFLDVVVSRLRGTVADLILRSALKESLLGRALQPARLSGILPGTGLVSPL